MPSAPARRYKLGYVLDTSLDPTDGVQQYVTAVGEWMRSRGHDVHYLVGETARRDLPNIHSLARNFTVSFNGNKTTIPYPTSRRHLRTFLSAHDFDILHVQTPHSPFMAQRLVRLAPGKTVVLGTFHVLPYGWLARYLNYVLGLWLRPSLRRFDAMLAVSSAAAVFEKQSFGLDAEILPNVIDYQRFHIAKPFMRYQDAIPTILFLGRLVERKGCLTLLQAAAALASGGLVPKFRVVICGRGPLEPQLRGFVAANELQDIVEFAGFVSEADKPRYYASADISVFPSYSGESFGIVLLEAMASGASAVLAGDNPGYHTVMEPQPDTLFAARDVKQLSDKLRQLLQNTVKRAELARWGADHAKTFDINSIGLQLESIYDRLYAAKNVR